jgi:hypothetical protein
MIFLDDLKKAKITKSRIIITYKSGVTLSCIIDFLTLTYAVMDKPKGKVVFFDTIEAVDFD